MLTPEKFRNEVDQYFDSVSDEQSSADSRPLSPELLELHLVTDEVVSPVAKVRSAESERNARRRKQRDERIKALKTARKNKVRH